MIPRPRPTARGPCPARANRQPNQRPKTARAPYAAGSSENAHTGDVSLKAVNTVTTSAVATSMRSTPAPSRPTRSCVPSGEAATEGELRQYTAGMLERWWGRYASVPPEGAGKAGGSLGIL